MKDLFPESTLLNSRGWTPELIAEVLDEPDVIHIFPRAEDQPTTRYYLRRRVHVAEQSETVGPIVTERAQQWETQRTAKREQEWKELQQAISIVEIGVKVMSIAELKASAIENFYARLEKDRRRPPSTIDKERIRKISLNYAIGQLVDYDAITTALPKPLDRRKIYDLISDRIAEKVLEVYPDLRIEREETVDV